MKSANYFLGISLLLMILFLFSCNKQPSSPAPALTVNDYSRAEQFLPWNTYNMVFGDEVAPKFLNDDKFWFRSHKESGHEFVIVDPIKRNRAPAFDHNRLASTLSVLYKQYITPKIKTNIKLTTPTIVPIIRCRVHHLL